MSKRLILKMPLHWLEKKILERSSPLTGLRKSMQGCTVRASVTNREPRYVVVAKPLSSSN